MIPKFLGRDCELSTTGVDEHGRSIEPGYVTQAVLRQIPRVLASRDIAVYAESSRFTSYSIDCLRRWIASGQCHYADMAHHEVCTPTCLDPRDFAAHSLAMVQIAEEARRLAQAADPTVRFSLSTANADVLDPGISFGTHVSVCIESDTWQDLFQTVQCPGRLAMVASGMAAAIPFFGAGYLLPWRDGTTSYSLSGRVHHLTRISSLSTTEPFGRGLLNSRREPHGKGFDRLHLIGFDFCLSSSALLASFLQGLMAAAEEKFCGLQLLEPVQALYRWSLGLNLQTGRLPERAVLVDGRQLTLPEYLEELTTILLKMCDSGLIGPDVAPRATDLLPKIIDLAQRAAAGDVEHCGRHLTWASKLLYLLNVCEQQGAQLGDPTTRLADHDFTNTDPARGAWWQLWEQGLVDPLVRPEEVAQAWWSPPENSRDAIRGRIIQKFGDSVSDLDWSYVELRESADRWGPRIRIELAQPDRASHAALDAVVAQAQSVAELAREIKRLNAASARDPFHDLTGDLDRPDRGSTNASRMLEA